jgi:hypothetical protein
LHWDMARRRSVACPWRRATRAVRSSPPEECPLRSAPAVSHRNAAGNPREAWQNAGGDGHGADARMGFGTLPRRPPVEDHPPVPLTTATLTPGQFGQAGAPADLYHATGIGTEDIIAAAFLALELAGAAGQSSWQRAHDASGWCVERPTGPQDGSPKRSRRGMSLMVVPVPVGENTEPVVTADADHVVGARRPGEQGGA